MVCMVYYHSVRFIFVKLDCRLLLKLNKESTDSFLICYLVEIVKFMCQLY